MPNPIAPGNHILLTMNEIKEMSNWELVCRIAGVDPLSVPSPITADSIVNIINRIQIRNDNTVADNELFTRDFAGKDSNLREPFDKYANQLRKNITERGFINSFHNVDGSTLLIDPESLDRSDMIQSLRVKQANIRAMATYYNYIAEQPIREENVLTDKINEAIAASRENKRFHPILEHIEPVFSGESTLSAESESMGNESGNRTNTEEFSSSTENTATGPAAAEPTTEPALAAEAAAEEPAPTRQAVESSHSRWIEEGINRYELEDIISRTPNESLDNGRKKRIQFLADLTGAALNENSTYDDYKTALESIIVNGKSAYDYFDLKNKPENKQTITVSVIPQLTEIIKNSFDSKVAKKDFIFIKKPEGDIVPLKLSNSLGASGSKRPEDVRDRLLSIDEAIGYVKSSYMLNFPDYVIDSRLADEKSEEFKAMVSANSINIGMIRGGNMKEIQEDATYATRLLAKSNTQLLEDYNKYFAPIVAACKAQPDYVKLVREAYAGSLSAEDYEIKREQGFKYMTRTEYYNAEQKVLTNYINSLTRPISYSAASGEPRAENEADQSPKSARQLLALQEQIDYRAEVMQVQPNSNSVGVNDWVTYNLKNDVTKLLEMNKENYDKYQRYKHAAEYNNKVNDVADTYLKKMNNESISRKEGWALQNHANSMPPKFSLSFDDLANPESLIKAIKEKDISYDDIIIDGKSFKTRLEEIASNITHKNGLNNLDEQDFKVIFRSGTFKKEIFEKFDKMIHPDKYPHMDNEPIMPVITLKTAMGEIAPTITIGKDLEPLPKVEPMSDFKRMLSKPDAIAANEKAVKEYEASVERMEARHKDNMSREAINEAIRINTKFSSGRALTPEERAFAASRNMNYPNPDVQPATLSTLQQRTNTAPQNLSLTQPTNTNENSNSMNGPQNGMGAGN